MEALTSAKLEPFFLQAKGARGAGVTKVIEGAIAAPGVWVFSELLDLPSVQSLSESFPQHIALLNLFAFGTWTDYLGNESSFPSLSQVMQTKLKHLTIVTLAKSHRTLPYSLLLSTLQIATVRELEDLLIEGMYHNLLKGKMDQKKLELVIEECVGRDVSFADEKDVVFLRMELESWAAATNAVIEHTKSILVNDQAVSAGFKAELWDYAEAKHAAIARLDGGSKGGGSAGDFVPALMEGGQTLSGGSNGGDAFAMAGNWSSDGVKKGKKPPGQPASQRQTKRNRQEK